jgi:hypothetical protein
MKLKAWALAGVSAALLAMPAVAHHSFAMFDNSQTLHKNGAVTGFEWINPHVWLHVEVDGQVWSFEAGSTGQLQQTNWTPESVAIGETLDVGFHPLKDGSNGGQLLEITKPDGTYLCQGGDCRERMEAASAAGQQLASLQATEPAPVAPAPAAPVEAKPIPDFAGFWHRRGEFPSTWEVPEDPALRPGPLVNTITGADAGLIWVADHTSPLLLPWNAEYLRARGEQELIEVNNVAHNICWPSGVPQVSNLREPLQILQSADQVTILYQRNHTIRRIYMNQGHPENVTPSWYGHSVGHYEGDVLVVDTIGLREGTGVDRFNTQHTEKLRVVERFQIIEGGQALRVTFMVEDPGAFTQPWYGQATYRQDAAFREVVCAENPRDITADNGEFPIPFDDTPDF